MQRIAPIPMKNVKLTDPFLSRAREIVRTAMLPYQWDALNDNIDGAEKSHAVENFRIAAGEAEGEFRGMVFQDSDLAKFLEAVGYILADNDDATLRDNAFELVRLIEKAQQPDGYMDTYFILKAPDGKFRDLRDAHELYCAGHMMEAAVALYENTGDRRLLAVMERFADLADKTFGPEEGKLQGYPGHEEVELALMKLYRATGKEKYMRLAKYFIDERGKAPCHFVAEGESYPHYWGGNDARDMSYYQAHLPVREQRDAVGHSVRAMYLYSGMADVAMETCDQSLIDALDNLWRSTTERRMYVTGGIGSTHHGEAFTFDHHLPNDTVYAETCAAIGLVFLAHRMMQMRPRGEYGDVLERALYGSVLSGVSLDGKRFFYVNPLEVWSEAVRTNEDLRHVKTERQPWFGCACCPPNVARIIASAGEYLLGTRGGDLYVHLYAGCEAKAIIDGKEVPIVIEGNYPWCGDIAITLPEGMLGGLHLRIPGWCKAWGVKLNGGETACHITDGYAALAGPFTTGARIELTLEMPAYRVWAHPSVRHDGGKVAIMRGPVCYCLEEIDNGAELNRLSLPRDAELHCTWRSDLLGGITVVSAKGVRDTNTEALYAQTPPASAEAELTFVPYFAWNNRGNGEMSVWVREEIK